MGDGEMKRVPRKPSRLNPLTRFSGGPDCVSTRTISDFWQWAHSDIMQNVERGVLAEYIVATLLGVDYELRIPWLAYDLKLPNGKTVEVKTMSLLQAWYQKELSNPRVVIKPTRKWDPKTNIIEATPKFHSDLYVICFFTADDHDTADPLNLAQWEFYVLPKERIKSFCKEKKSISLEFLREQSIKSTTAFELRDEVMELCKSTSRVLASRCT
jgi:hypothetical protein